MNQVPGYITRFAIALLLKLLLRNKGKHFFLKVIPTATVAVRIGSYNIRKIRLECFYISFSFFVNNSEILNILKLFRL